MEMISRVMEMFAQLDQQIAAFQLKSGLRCPTGCGRCCPEADVQTTVIEMMPIAHDLLFRGESAMWLERIQAAGQDGCCVFYQRQPMEGAPGHCGGYALRPAVCRLFGFAAVRDRTGAPKFAPCKHLKAFDSEVIARACSLQHEAPCFADFGTLFLTLEMRGARMMPINAALYQALMRLGLYMQMSHGEALGTTSAA